MFTAAIKIPPKRSEAKSSFNHRFASKGTSTKITKHDIPGLGNGEYSPTEKVNLVNHPIDKPYCTSITQVPVTFERKPHVWGPDGRLNDAGTARATIAASKECPNGTLEGNWAAKHEHQTVLQQHASYWDSDQDGIVWPRDTYNGLRAWGWGIPLCIIATLFINPGLSYPTVSGFLPDPFMRVYINNIHKSKHGSDTSTYDNEGRFIPQSFEDIFAKYDDGNKGGLDKPDIYRMLKGQRNVFDPFGWLASALEWIALYLLLWPDDGIMRKDDVRRAYDGSIFQNKADEYARKMAK